MTAVHAIDPAAAPLRSDLRTMGLVGLAHGTSHFFHMLLPPLFPWLISDFGLSYSQLGLTISVFFIVSGIGQALSGFVVDKLGARPVLYAALACFALAALAVATAQGYASLLLAAALAGLGNSPFHPVDFTILNRRVSAARLGHAFSAHGISGNLGWAVAPALLTTIATLSGSWRMAAASAAVLALAVLALMWLQRDALDDRGDVATPHAPPAAGAGPLPRRPHSPLGGRDGVPTGPGAPFPLLAFLKLPSVWLCFTFFFWATLAYSAVQSFAAPSLVTLYALPWAQAAFVVTAYMLCTAAGTAAGGFLVSRTQRLERTVAFSLLASAAMLALAGTAWLPGAVALTLTALAGFGAGLSAPSRDMLIRRASPPGATGRVYGLVYSGLDLGFAIGAPAFGALLDAGHPGGVFYGAALALVCGVLTAWQVGSFDAARAQRRAVAATGGSAA